MSQNTINRGLSPNDGTGDSLYVGAGKINDNFTELYGYAENTTGSIRYINFANNWGNTNIYTSLLNYINAGTITKDTEILKFRSIKNTTTGYQEHIWEFKKGLGIYGATGTTVVQNDLQYLGEVVTDVEEGNFYFLGEIGTDEIQDVVNNSGPYDTPNGEINLFRAERSGERYDYFYIGRFDKIGVGETPTSNTAYVEIAPNEEIPPDTSDLVPYSVLDSIQYDSAQYYLTDVIANADPAGAGNEDFVIIETDDFYYFGQKDTNAVDFNNCRLVIRQNGFKYDFEATPDNSHGGYNYWELESTSNIDLTPPNGVSAFSFFRKFVTGGGAINAGDVSYDDSGTPEIPQSNVQDAIVDIVKKTIQDSGWQNVTYGSSSDLGTSVLEVKKIGNRIILNGFLAIKSGANLNNVLATLPVGYRPDRERLFANYAAYNGLSQYSLFVKIDTNGELTLPDVSDYKDNVASIDIEFTQNIN